MARREFWDVIERVGFKQDRTRYYYRFGKDDQYELNFELRVIGGWDVALYERVGDSYVLMWPDKITISSMELPSTKEGLERMLSFLTGEGVSDNDISH